MRRYRLQGPAGGDRLQLTETPRPEPGPRDVLVRIGAVSLNYRDLMVFENRYAGGGVRDGLVPCSDGAGTVVAVGDQVDRLAVGDRVAGLFLPRWQGGPYDERYGQDALGGGRDGVLADYVLFDQEALVAVPPHLSLIEAACLPCAALTAWNALFGGDPLVPGQDVLLLGTGGVSLFALLFARMTGAHTILLTTRADKRARALDLGADAVIVRSEVPDWPSAVRALTGGQGADHVVEVVGGANVGASVQACRNGGQVHLIGAQASGDIDPTALRRRNVVLRGLYVGSRSQFQAMNRALTRSGARPVVDTVFPFEAAAEAYRHLRSGVHLGKVVISLDPATV
ncbi:MAG: NAD(P)-dependent alcohol dehydrogenase [Rhodobacter sp.]|nr:NAD(P)-dependent alcohol dehydrogenase [Paracoccaceae bacterium]MCC0077271.1 NAD(P)-dependent alcohol dehydrogenase [Rhodobacter sp.]